MNLGHPTRELRTAHLKLLILSCSHREERAVPASKSAPEAARPWSAGSSDVKPFKYI
jgi:hypothetical protein